MDLRDWLEKQQILEFALDICRAVPISSFMIEHNGCRTKYMFQDKMRTSIRRFRKMLKLVGNIHCSELCGIGWTFFPW